MPPKLWNTVMLSHGCARVKRTPVAVRGRLRVNRQSFSQIECQVCRLCRLCRLGRIGRVGRLCFAFEAMRENCVQIASKLLHIFFAEWQTWLEKTKRGTKENSIRSGGFSGCRSTRKAGEVTSNGTSAYSVIVVSSSLLASSPVRPSA
jgi:hypothetical protein